MLTPTLTIIASLMVGGFHLPHDSVHDLATCTLSNGRTGLLAVGNTVVNAQFSDDLGLTWTLIDGEGLQQSRAVKAVWYPHPTNPRFFIGTQKGVYTFNPETWEVQQQGQGWPNNKRAVVDLSASLTGDGPLLAATEGGKVMPWDESSNRWTTLLSGAEQDKYGQVVIAPDFDQSAGPGRSQAVFAAFGGVLHQSEDGGSSWTIHPQFNTAAQSESDWSITALAVSTNYQWSGQVLIGRGRESLSTSTGNEGEIWSSLDGAQNFSLSLSASSSVRSLLFTSPAANGRRHAFASFESFPEPNSPDSHNGVLCSVDGGVSWEAQENFRDMLLEVPDTSVPARMARLQGLVASPNYNSDGRLFHGRAEGIYRSDSGGRYWRQLRLRNEGFVRRLDVERDSNGDITIFGGTYGSGSLVGRLEHNQAGDLELKSMTVLDSTKVAYQKPCRASADFARDGLLVASGSEGVVMWFDPAKTSTNVWGRKGWVQPIQNTVGYVKTLELSPHFSALKGSLDQTIIFSTRSNGNGPIDFTWLSRDCGRSYEALDTVTGGGDMPFLNNLLITEEFDAQAATLGGVYATAGPFIFRLDGLTWTVIGEAQAYISDLKPHPDFPSQRLLYAIEQGTGVVVEIEVPLAADAILTPLAIPAFSNELQKLALPSDFASSGVLFASTTTQGVWKIDKSASSPQWQQVGNNFPSVLTWPIALSPDFAADGGIIAGCRDGFILGKDELGSSWELLAAPITTDSSASWLTYFNPNEPGNPNPMRPRAWDSLKASRIPGQDINVCGLDVAYSFHDGAKVVWEGYASSVEVRSFSGGLMGEVLVRVKDFWTGAVLSETLTDLHVPGGSVQDIVIATPPLGSRKAIEVEVIGQLSQGQAIAFDGIRALP